MAYTIDSVFADLGRVAIVIMVVTLILDAIAVRSLLVPALVALFGRLGMWPGNRRTPQVRVEPRVSAGAGSMGRPG